MIAQILDRFNHSKLSQTSNKQIIDLVGAARTAHTVHLGVIAENRRSGQEIYFYLITNDQSFAAVVDAIRTHRGIEWQVYETFDVTPLEGHTLTAV